MWKICIFDQWIRCPFHFPQVCMSMVAHLFVSQPARGNLNKSTKAILTDIILFQVICFPSSCSVATPFFPFNIWVETAAPNMNPWTTFNLLWMISALKQKLKPNLGNVCWFSFCFIIKCKTQHFKLGCCLCSNTHTHTKPDLIKLLLFPPCFAHSAQYLHPVSGTWTTPSSSFR